MIPCDKCPHKTNPEGYFCCGIIPFPLKFLEEHREKFQENGELKENGEQAVILTKDFLCVFFNRIAHNCAIYDERPDVCRVYGTIDRLKCPYYKRSGNLRSSASQRQTIRQINKEVDKFIENTK
jgi:Fe-S-cluster containining protein